MPTTHSDRQIELDDTDRAVLRARVRDVRASVREITADTGIAANKVDDSLARLEAAGVIEGYTARVDYDRLGYDVTALLWLSLTDAGALDRLRETRGLVTVYEVTGDHDAFAVGKFPDAASLNATVTGLLTDEGVATLRTTLAVGALREFDLLVA